MEFEKGDGRVLACYLLLLPAFLMACHGMQTTVAPENRILLQDGGPHAGTWESKTMLLDYEYYKQPGEIKLSLQIKIKTKARYDGYRVWVRFANDPGKILEEKSISSWENTLTIPPGTVYMSFRTFLQPHVYKPKIYR
jgi:hypothetical protein